MAPVRLQELFALLRQDEYRTARQLAGQLGVSEKTVRTRLRELNDELEKNGAKVVSRARFGYRLEVWKMQGNAAIISWHAFFFVQGM